MVQKIPNKRSYIKFFNGKKLTFAKCPCVIGGYTATGYLLYVKGNKNRNRILNVYCVNMSHYIKLLMTKISENRLSHLFHPQFFRLVNRNYMDYDYVVWVAHKDIDKYYHKTVDKINIPVFAA